MSLKVASLRAVHGKVKNKGGHGVIWTDDDPEYA